MLVLGRVVDDRRRHARALDDPGSRPSAPDARPAAIELVGEVDVERSVRVPWVMNTADAEPRHRRERALAPQPRTVESARPTRPPGSRTGGRWCRRARPGSPRRCRRSRVRPDGGDPRLVARGDEHARRPERDPEQADPLRWRGRASVTSQSQAPRTSSRLANPARVPATRPTRVAVVAQVDREDGEPVTVEHPGGQQDPARRAGRRCSRARRSRPGPSGSPATGIHQPAIVTGPSGRRTRPPRSGRDQDTARSSTGGGRERGGRARRAEHRRVLAGTRVIRS